MKRFFCTVICLSTLGLAQAADNEVSVSRSVQLTAPPQQVWNALGDFCSAEKWDGGVVKCEIVAGKANQPGAVRLLTLRAGGTAREELVRHDAQSHQYTYRIVAAGLPVTDYVSTISVMAKAGGAEVQWQSHFKPAKGSDAATASRIIAGIYEGGLASLKTTLEKQPAR